MKHDLILVKLNQDQIARAKQANGISKRITHALIGDPYGQILGTERQCLKYFTVWDPTYRFEVGPGRFKAIFPNPFAKAVGTDSYEITAYKTTWGLVEKLIQASES